MGLCGADSSPELFDLTLNHGSWGYNPGVQPFSSAREAKEFLIDRIVSQAQRDGVSLSEG
jgi:hypothetical protein